MPEVLDDTSQALESTTVAINRTSTTVKGGRRLSFSALVVVGDRHGKVGLGYGKGRGVPAAIEKAQKAARRNMFSVVMNNTTIPHTVQGNFLASSVRLIPAAPGTGVIAGGTVRAVLEMAGIHDCLSKAYGSTNKANLAKAVIEGLKRLRTRETVANLRGVSIETSAVDEMLEANRKAQKEASEALPAQPVKLPESVTKKQEPAEEAKAEEAPAEEAKTDEAPAENAQASADEAPAEEAKADAPEADTASDSEEAKTE